MSESELTFPEIVLVGRYLTAAGKNAERAGHVFGRSSATQPVQTVRKSDRPFDLTVHFRDDQGVWVGAWLPLTASARCSSGPVPG